MLNKEMLQKIAIKYDTTPSTINHIYNIYWKWLRDHVSKLDLKSMKEPQPIHANMTVPGIGELIIDEPVLKALNERHCNKENQTNE